MSRRVWFLLVLAAAAHAEDTAHPGLFRPGHDAMVRAAQRSDLHDLGRAWHLEARLRQLARPARRCRECDRPVIRRNADLCGDCAARWRTIAARGWDLRP